MFTHREIRTPLPPRRVCSVVFYLILASLCTPVGHEGRAANPVSPPPYVQLQPTVSGRPEGSSRDINPDDYVNQHQYTLQPPLAPISGRVLDGDSGGGLSGVSIRGLPGDPATDAAGDYSAVVPSGWSGAATPSKAGYSFSPSSRTYMSIAGSQSGQDYTGTSAAILSVTPARGLATTGTEGGPFDRVRQEYTLMNAGTQPLDWSATNTQAWVSLSEPRSGTLAAGAGETVTVWINPAAADLGAGMHVDTASFTNATTHSGDTTRRVQILVAGTCSWTHRGFDLQVRGSLAAPRWDPHTNDRYVMVPYGGRVTLTVIRNASLRRADHSPSPSDNTRVHVGLLTIADRQFWTPDWDSYQADGSFVYASPFSVGPIDAPTAVQIWNQHPGCDFDPSDWLAYGSNALEVWLIPTGLEPGNLPPVDYTNGGLPAGELSSAPPGAWPALYRDAGDLFRLHNAVADLGTELHGDGGPYDDSSHGNYWTDLSGWAARNALIGWHTGSSAHLNEARQQLLGLVSVRTFTNECALWSRARCVPNADLTTSYGRELSNIFFEALLTTCVLGPNMTNALAPDDLNSVNAHLYRFAIHDIFASLTPGQYYTANGSINLHYHPICVTAGWNWNVPAAVAIADALPQPTHTECSYFIDWQGIGQYALCYCELHVPEEKWYEHAGNSQSVRYWLRFAEFFGQRIDVYAAERYVRDHYAGLSLDCQDALDALMDNWRP